MCRPGHVRLQTLFLSKVIIYLYWTYFRPNTGKKTHKLCRQGVAEDAGDNSTTSTFYETSFKKYFLKGVLKDFYLLIQYSPVRESLKLSCWWVKNDGWHIWDRRKCKKKSALHKTNKKYFFKCWYIFQKVLALPKFSCKAVDALSAQNKIAEPTTLKSSLFPDELPKSLQKVSPERILEGKVCENSLLASD